MSKTKQASPAAIDPGWCPIHELPTENAGAQFMVRASTKGRAVLARLKRTRAYDQSAMRYLPTLILVDAATGVKLGFKPVEFMAAPVEPEETAA